MSIPIPIHRLMLMLLALTRFLCEVENPATVSMIPYRTNSPPISDRMSKSLAAADFGASADGTPADGAEASDMTRSFLGEDDGQHQDDEQGASAQQLGRCPPGRLGHARRVRRVRVMHAPDQA